MRNATGEGPLGLRLRPPFSFVLKSLSSHRGLNSNSALGLL